MHPDNVGGLGFEREETWSGAPNASSIIRNENRHYIQVPGATVVVKTVNGNDSSAALSGTVGTDANDVVFWHKDALGSAVTVSNIAGSMVEDLNYDAWGRKLRANGAVDRAWAPSQHADRGYTGHENLDEIGLVHMNGRVYDLVLARFLSPDPINTVPDYLQNYNAYTYALNNPMRFTDPSGNCPWCFVFIAGLILASEGNKYWSVVGTVMMAIAAPTMIEAGLGNAVQVSAYAGTYGAGAEGFAASAFNVGGAGNAFAAGALSAAARPGATVESVATGAIFAVAFNAAGGLAATEKLAVHAVLGCMQGAAGGGSCGPSALAALVGKGATEVGSANGLGPGALGLVTVVAGGTASVIGGGKFGSGAAQAAFGYLFNCLAHQDCVRYLRREGDGYLETRYVGGVAHEVKFAGLCATTDCLGKR